METYPPSELLDEELLPLVLVRSLDEDWREEARACIEMLSNKNQPPPPDWQFLTRLHAEEQQTVLRRARVAVETARHLADWEGYLFLESGGRLETERQTRRTAQRATHERLRRARRLASLSRPKFALWQDFDPQTAVEALAMALHRQWSHDRPTGMHAQQDLSSAKRLLRRWPDDVALVHSEGPVDPALLDATRPDWWRDSAEWRAHLIELLTLLPPGWSVQRQG